MTTLITAAKETKSCSDGKEMYKKYDARVVVLLNIPIAFLTFSLPSPSCCC